MPKAPLNTCFYIVLTAGLGIFSVPAQAEIFVCKDQKNHITYQQEPCTTKTVRVLKREPAVPLIEQQKAQTRIDNANKSFEAYAAKTEVERLQSEKLALERENLELERRAIQLRSQEYAQQPVIINPNLYGNRFPFGNRPFGYKGNQFKPQPNQQFTNSQSNGPFDNLPDGHPYSKFGRQQMYNNDAFRMRLDGGNSNRSQRFNSQQR